MKLVLSLSLADFRAQDVPDGDAAGGGVIAEDMDEEDVIERK